MADLQDAGKPRGRCCGWTSVYERCTRVHERLRAFTRDLREIGWWLSCVCLAVDWRVEGWLVYPLRGAKGHVGGRGGRSGSFGGGFSGFSGSWAGGGVLAGVRWVEECICCPGGQQMHDIFYLFESFLLHRRRSRRMFDYVSIRVRFGLKVVPFLVVLFIQSLLLH